MKNIKSFSLKLSSKISILKMKRTLFVLIIASSSVLLLENCSKKNMATDYYVYSDVENSVGPLTFFVDGKNLGSIPNLRIPISQANSQNVINNCLHFQDKKMNLKLEAKNQQGDVVAHGEIKKDGHLYIIIVMPNDIKTAS